MTEKVDRSRFERSVLRQEAVILPTVCESQLRRAADPSASLHWA